MTKRGSYSMGYITAGWIAVKDPRPDDMWQEMMHFEFIVDDAVYHDNELVGVIVREFKRDTRKQWLPTKDKENQVFWSMTEFVNKISYQSDKSDINNLPKDGKNGLLLHCIREFNKRSREYVCYLCKLEVTQGMVTIDEKDYHDVCFYTPCSQRDFELGCHCKKCIKLRPCNKGVPDNVRL